MAIGIVVPYTFATQNGPLPLANLDSDILTPYQALSAFATYGNYLVDSSGAANTITVTTPTNTTFSYTAGVPIQVKLANTTTSTSVSINVNGLGSVSVLNADGTNPVVGQLVATQILPMIYDGTAMRLSGPQSKPSSIAPFTATAAGNVTLPAPSSGTALAVTGVTGQYAVTMNAATNGVGALVAANNVTGQSYGLLVQAGTNTTDYALKIANSTGSQMAIVNGDGGVVLGGATGASQGTGTLNVSSGLFINAAPVYAGIPQNFQTASYTFVLSDANKHILHVSGTAHTFTIPANSSVPYPVGTAITIVNGGGSGVITLAINSDTLTWTPSGATGSRSLAATSVCTIIKVVSNIWYLSGNGIT